MSCGALWRMGVRMNDPVHIEGSNVTINGVNLARCWELMMSQVTGGRLGTVSGDATDTEKEIAKRVARKAEMMRRKGYGPEPAAAMAKRLLKNEALKVQATTERLMSPIVVFPPIADPED